VDEADADRADDIVADQQWQAHHPLVAVLAEHVDQVGVSVAPCRISLRPHRDAAARGVGDRRGSVQRHRGPPLAGSLHPTAQRHRVETLRATQLVDRHRVGAHQQAEVLHRDVGNLHRGDRTRESQTRPGEQAEPGG
jgi:hypothetical protein